MKHLLTAMTGLWLCCSACGHHAQQTPATASDSLSRRDTADSHFFPVAGILESEIIEMDSLPIAKKEYIIRKGHTDSAYLDPAEFHALAMQFLVPEFRDGSFEKNFTESSFIDNATQDATFTYASVNRDMPLQRVDVVTEPQGSVHHLKSVYLERHRLAGDSSILDKMYWRAGHSFEVISMIRVGSGAPTERRLKVVWGADGDNE